MSYGIRSYKSSRANTASREDLLILLYEGAIRFLERSLQEKRDGRLAEHKTFLQKASAIISELQNTLDFDKGGQLAVQLFELYNFMLDSLTKANVKKEEQPIQDVIQMLTVLLDGWRDAVRQVKSQGGLQAAMAGQGQAVAANSSAVMKAGGANKPKAYGAAQPAAGGAAVRPTLTTRTL
ncbi:flagellar export chaperone FliS [Magnetofaba australis]|uniref:Putative flagellar protein FliS n=1 Tax=Magnetofaba australis IT-1 TaxID=1434232 RepID=A0A1Y2K6Z6_9PROT|nr:flagellar export chaperone FliS [Magnetofaba australis]OSM06109.1 putative flagellar protein FliS [Magnetofaba australis IT-1]